MRIFIPSNISSSYIRDVQGLSLPSALYWRLENVVIIVMTIYVRIKVAYTRTHQNLSVTVRWQTILNRLKM